MELSGPPPPVSVVSIEPGAGLIVPHIMPKEAWVRLRRQLDKPDTAVAMKLGYADWRHLKAIVIDARLMLELQQHVIVHLRIAQFDDGL